MTAFFCQLNVSFLFKQFCLCLVSREDADLFCKDSLPVYQLLVSVQTKKYKRITTVPEVSQKRHFSFCATPFPSSVTIPDNDP